ncbi:hypothetical protein Cni_G22454 [Canna indica]|uniref:DUF7781 domain-containing protein n=1 Tax=Canna indica TaxID=4628 RepID=A0AAQ3QLM9_9LILI|nr:hypothetical protein Cni_G22454 [Canna indica]
MAVEVEKCQVVVRERNERERERERERESPVGVGGRGEAKMSARWSPAAWGATRRGFELYNFPANEYQAKFVLKPISSDRRWKFIYEPLHGDIRLLSKKIPLTKYLNLQVGIGHSFHLNATGWKWKLSTCLGGDGVSQIRNKTSIGLCQGVDLRIGWRAEYILPEIHGFGTRTSPCPGQDFHPFWCTEKFLGTPKSGGGQGLQLSKLPLPSTEPGHHRRTGRGGRGEGGRVAGMIAGGREDRPTWVGAKQRKAALGREEATGSDAEGAGKRSTLCQPFLVLQHILDQENESNKMNFEGKDKQG